MRYHWLIALTLCALSLSASAAVDRNLKLPNGMPSADELARQVYFTNHLYAFENFSIARKGKHMTVLINRNSDGKTSRAGVERHLNNNYSDGPIKARDLAVFRSGNLRGTGILVTEYTDPDKSNSYSVWLPALRKVRRFAQPAHDDPWGGSVFTFGDVTLRTPDDETHEIIGKKPLKTCLGAIDGLEGKSFVHVKKLPKRTCRHVGKEVYGLKSTTKFDNWWYDYRISFIDTKNFADYRTVYYKGGKMVKVIDRDWGLVTGAGKDDPRALFWKYWYGIDLVNNRQSWAVVPQDVIEFDTNRKNKYWSEKTLRRLKR